MQRQLLPKPPKARALALFRFFILNQHSKQKGSAYYPAGSYIPLL